MFAVAGPRKGDTVYLTNLGWQFDINDIQAEFDFCDFQVINDFAAFAYAAPYIRSEANTLIKSGC